MIEPGQILDKYELIEKVGAGGMAVVYRGHDRTLKREVAVKVLHTHLADHPEARRRFEREAQAVAKLRHENILEIFDYSGPASDESYIVTEFIRGQTLKEFVTERQPGFPEIAAMICAQVCRALAHAHGLSILHRDVKPENIMIRDDGCIKLMDFGIAQMLDTHRLTVTGQLLGSPAYMSPEHVQGKPLDVRTDVFAVGIVLYQLVTGELPFRGRNPHEILKRIADGEYEPAEQLEPKVGRELGGIIRTSLAREKDDRYADVTQMLTALEGYLEGSGFSDTRAELARFFAAPSSYEMALAQRLVDHLSRRGRAELADNRAAALELFNRVLTIDPDNEAVLAEIERLSRRRRGARLVALCGGVVALGAAALAGSALLGGESTPPAVTALGANPDAAPMSLGLDAAGALASESALTDAGGEALAALPGRDAAPARRGDGVRGDGIRGEGARGAVQPRVVVSRADAAPAVIAAPQRSFTLSVFPRSSHYRIDDGAWLPYPGEPVELALEAGEHVVRVRNDDCCTPVEHRIGADDRGRRIDLTAPFSPGQLRAVCDRRDVTVRFDGRPVPLGRWRTFLIRSPTGTEQVQVEFITDDGTISKTATVGYKGREEVRCD